MVSSKVEAQLREAFDALCKCTIEVHDYAGDAFAAVFDIYTQESFVAGIAEKLLNHAVIGEQDRRIVATNHLHGHCWLMVESGKRVSLAHLPEVLEYAQRINDVQRLCLRLMGRPRKQKGFGL
jgi:hypothetical protein